MKDDGGAAFPSGGTELDHVEVNPDGSPRPIFKAIPGMSLRDYFAGQALMGILSNSEFEKDRKRMDKKFDDDKQTKAVMSVVYAFADAMLAERAKGDV